MALKISVPTFKTVLVAQGGTTSPAVSLRDGSRTYSNGTVTNPALEGATTWKYQVSLDGTNWVDLRRADGSAAFPAMPQAANAHGIPFELFGFPMFRIVCSGAQTSAARLFSIQVI